MAKEKRERKEKRNGSKTWILALVLLSAGYFLMQTLQYVINPLETMKAVAVTVDESISVSGYFVRNETIIDVTATDKMELMATSGEKISKGSKIAASYATTEGLNLSRRLSEIESRLSLLDYAISSTGDISDSAKMDQMIRLQMLRIQDMNHFDDVLADVEKLRAMLFRRNQSSINESEIKAEMDTLKKEKKSLEAQLAKSAKMIYSPFSGYFSSEIDGFESLLKASEVGKFTGATVTELDGRRSQKSQYIAKVISGFNWYFIANLTKAQTDFLTGNKKVTLRFGAITDETLPASVYKLEKNKDGSAFLILESKTMNTGTSTMRKQTAQIILNTYGGLKIPKEALRVVNGEEGVFILSGQLSRFKPIEVLYETQDYYVIRSDKTTQKSVLTGDEIIVKSRGIGEKKVVKS